MKDKTIYFKVVFSITFFGFFIFMICSEWAKENINALSIGILLIAFLPWIIKYIKSVEMFGVKAEIISEKEMNKVDDMIKPNIIKETENIINGIEESNQTIHCDAYNSVINAQDSISMLVLGRYELEKIIRKLAEKYDLEASKSVYGICKELHEKDYISDNEYAIIKEILPILNKAIHSQIENVDERQIEWIRNKIIVILEHLDYRYKTNEDFNDWLRI